LCEENLFSLSVWPISRLWDARRFSPRRRRFGPRNQSLIVPILFQITVQSGPPDSQHLRRPQSISFAHRQHSLNVLLSHFFLGQGPPIIPAADPSRAVLQMAARLAWGSGDISRTRHCPSFVVSNGSACLCRKKVSSSETICLPCSDLTRLGRAQNFIRINRFVAKASIGPYT
jgi:hypothetical protein